MQRRRHVDSRLWPALALGLVALLSGCATVEEPGPRPLTAEEGRALVTRLLPESVKERGGWATDIYAAFATLGLAPTPENICAAVAVTEQESGFQVDPVVPGLAAITASIARSIADSSVICLRPWAAMTASASWP